MKSIYRFATMLLLMFAVSVCGFAQRRAARPATTTQNLVRGMTGPISSDAQWSNFSAMNLIPGSALYSLTSSSTVLYLGFTAGTTADIGHAVLYTTARGSLKITAVTPVKLGGVSNPSINLSNTSVCPVQPLSVTNPCVVRFDPIALALSPASDYYLMVYFTNDTNNVAVAAAQATNLQTSLSGSFFGGDSTNLAVGQTLPGIANREANFLMYVMNN
jgi:hypothetical protein